MNWVHPTSLLIAAWLVPLVQASPLLGRLCFGVQPEFLPALVVYAAFRSGLATTAAVAILGGAFYDAMSSGPFGLSLITLSLTGVVIHRRRDLVLWNSVVPQVALGVLATLVVSIATLAALGILGPLQAGGDSTSGAFPDIRPGGDGGPEIGIRQGVQCLWLALVGGIVTPPIFWFFGWVERSFNYQPAPVPVNRADREIRRGRF